MMTTTTATIEARVPHTRSEGFTLVETLVALVIVGIGFGLAFIALPSGLRAQDSARRLEAAAEIAQNVLSGAGTIPTDGSDGAFAWHLQSTALPGETVPGGTLAGQRVMVTVSWAEGGHQRSIGAETVRLGAIARAP